ncbi:MAG: hypothetical protein K2O94_00850 [Clostridiales bacterium]|nr:hypothetical protein [Clostridiales bacterium]
MNKKKEIEEMGKAMCEKFRSDHCGNDCECANEFIAEKLINAGYGNVKQAVKEFGEKLKKEFTNYCELPIKQSCNIVDNLITELYGADE